MAASTRHHHPVARVVADMRASCDEIADTQMWSMDGPEAGETLLELGRLEAQIAALKAKTLARVDQADLAAETGASGTANWYAHAAKVTRPQAHRELRLAKTLEEHTPTREALAAGQVHLDQATAVLNAVAQLPDDLGADVVEKAERHLLAEAAHHDAKHLRVLGKHLVEVAAPEIADAHTVKLLEKEERDAAADTRLTLWDDNQGRTHFRGVVPTAIHGVALRKILNAFAAPKHRASAGPLGEPKPTPERLGQALCELVTRIPADLLPRSGGLNATVVVTMTLETLLGGLKAAQLDTGEEISAGMARRLACEAGIIPAVLDGKSHVLDVGHLRRFHTTAQRIVATVEQRTCRAEGCDWPAGMCHMHHPLPWSQGGTTGRDGMLLCPHHHARAHDTGYDMTKLSNGEITFHRRC